MSQLINAWHEVARLSAALDENPAAQAARTGLALQQREAEYRLLEQLTFSGAAEIEAFLDDMQANYYDEVPVWLRNLAFRLACLLQPGNAVIRRRAANDLRAFGPDWDDIAAGLDQEAAALEGQR
ncbi:MAG: hypothetical protein MUD01_14145 [Chloroflexaceae bacterium]|jgi:hypothetical protein|nr:hypothetical protein [Chloroflexaceae bacterium]